MAHRPQIWSRVGDLEGSSGRRRGSIVDQTHTHTHTHTRDCYTHTHTRDCYTHTHTLGIDIEFNNTSTHTHTLTVPYLN